MQITDIEHIQVHVSEKTEWVFLKVHCSDGLFGVGEATISGQEDDLREMTDRARDELRGTDPRRINMLGARRQAANEDKVAFAVWSAVEQALLDVNARRLGIPVSELLGGVVADTTPVYANVNRRTTDRTPDGFARSTSDALAAGFNAVKIAPFDGFNVNHGPVPDFDELYGAGLDRIAAVRRAIGPDIRLMVDCHWRFTEDLANTLIEEVAEQKLYWLECPIPENHETVPALARLRERCAAKGMLFAGCEFQLGLEGFAPFIENRALDVVMPDVKYAGGIEECRRIARLAEVHGVGLSPHNPSGPISHAASLHLVATIPNCFILEHQFNESPLFDSLVGHKLPKIIDGAVSPPADPGLGVDLEDV